MMSYRVRFTPEAAEHADDIAAWWAINRPAAPLLFVEELEAAVATLRVTPNAAPPYGHDARLRRLILPRYRQHVYYDVVEDERLVRIRAIWHASRGHGPFG